MTRPQDIQSAPSADAQDVYESTPYATELYDLFTVRGDGPIYEKSVREMQKLRPDAERYWIIDLGTGSGRIIRDLVTSIDQSHPNSLIDKSRLTFTGVDLSANMLKRAQSIPIPGLSTGQVTWAEGSASELDNIPMVAKMLTAGNRCDLVIFAYSTVCYLIGPGELEQFLRAVANVLRPGTGRAYISIHHDAIASKRDGRQETELRSDTDAVHDLPSQDFPGIVYRSRCTDVRCEGSLRSMAYELKVIRPSSQGDEVVEVSHLKHTVRIWEDADELPRRLAPAGLRLAETIQAENETVYVVALR